MITKEIRGTYLAASSMASLKVPENIQWKTFEAIESTLDET